MEVQEIEAIIDKDGNVTLKVNGVAGMSCLQLTADLEKALGGEVVERNMTSEAYSETQEANPDRLNLGW